MEGSIAGFGFVTEFTLWLGVVIMAIRVVIATVAFARKNQAKIRASASSFTEKVSSGAAMLRRHLTSKRGSSAGGLQGGGSMIELGEHKTAEVDIDDGGSNRSGSNDRGYHQEDVAEEEDGGGGGSPRRKMRHLRLLRKSGSGPKEGHAGDHRGAKGSGAVAQQEAAAGLVGMDSASETSGPLAWTANPTRGAKQQQPNEGGAKE